MKSLFLILNILLPLTIYSQSSREATIALPQGFGIELLNSNGSSGILNNTYNISAMNPAAISQLQNLSLGLSYQFQTNIPDAYALDISTHRVYNYLPQSIGGAYHYNQFSFGVGAGQKYNGSFEYGPILSIDPDSTGGIYTPELSNILHYYSLIAAYSFKDLFERNSELSFGLKYNLNSFYTFEKILDFEESSSMWGSNFEIGTLYKFNYEQEKEIIFGLAYKSVASLEKNDEPALIVTTGIPGSVPGSGTYTVASPGKTILELPAEFDFDFAIQTTDKWTFTVSFKDVFWNGVQDNIKNQPEFSASGIYDMNKSNAISLGVFYTNKVYETDVFDMNGKFEALFMTAGISLNINFLNVDIALADSHLFSGEYRKQTIGKIALGIQL